MQVRFVGAIHGVTGSCTHFRFPRTGTEFLVDCGMSQGETHSDAENARAFPFRPRRLKFILLTHGHIDHCGLIPRLYREGFRGSVKCTAATAKITKAALLDAAQHTRDFDRDDVEKIIFEHVDDRPDFGLSKLIPIDTDLFAGFSRSAHILGSISITLSWKTSDTTFRRMVLSGDLGSNTKENQFQPLLGARQNPYGYPEYILMESTYGGRFRDAKFASFEGRIEALADAIDNAFSSGNVLLIPAFCLQRAQDLLFDIRYVLTRSDRTFAKTPIEVVIDSPLAQQYMEIFGEELCRRQTHKTDEPVHRNRSLADRLGMSDEDAVDDLIRDLYRGTPSDEAFPCGHHTIRYVSQRVKNDGGKKIIISGSGMCRGGPVMSYLRDLLPDPRATIMLTGYMAPGTPGALIEKFGTCTAEGKPVPFREIKLGAKTVETADIKAKVIEMKSFYSGHADQHGLLDFVFRVHGKKIGEKEVPATVFINHGDCQSRNALREAIRKRVRNRDERQVDRVEIPSDSTKWFDLDAGDWLQVEPGDEILSAILAEQERTNDLLRDMASILVMTVARKRKIKKQADPRIANGR